MSDIYAGSFASTSAIIIPVELTCRCTKIHPILKLLCHQSQEILLHFLMSVDSIIATRVLRHETMNKNSWQCGTIIFIGGTTIIYRFDRQKTDEMLVYPKTAAQNKHYPVTGLLE